MRLWALMALTVILAGKGCTKPVSTVKPKAAVRTAATLTAPLIITAQCPPAIVGVPYKCQLTATGGTPPYTWSLVPPLQPPTNLHIIITKAKNGSQPQGR